MWISPNDDTILDETYWLVIYVVNFCGGDSLNFYSWECDSTISEGIFTAVIPVAMTWVSNDGIVKTIHDI